MLEIQNVDFMISIVSVTRIYYCAHTGSVLHHYETELKRLRMEYAGLTPSKRTELEDLLMEGDLLEVTMDEVQQIWNVLHQDAESLAAYGRSALGEEEAEEEDRRKRRKRKDPSPSTSVVSNASSEGSMSKVPSSKRRKRVTRSTTPKLSPSPAPSSASSHSE